MARGLSTTLKTELAKSNFAWALLAKLEFNSTYYFTTCQHDLSSGGNTYLSSGMLLDLSEIGEDSGISTGGITLTLSAAATSLMTDLLTNGHLHRQITVSLALLDSDHAIIDSPFELYRGRVESMSIKDTAKTSTLELGVANHWADFERSNGRSFTDNAQQQRYSGDKGFEFAAQAGDDMTWGKFYSYEVSVLLGVKPKWKTNWLGIEEFDGYEFVWGTETRHRFSSIESVGSTVKVNKLPVCYGTHKVPGFLIFQEVSSDHKFLYQCYAVSEGQVASVSAVFDPPMNTAQTAKLQSFSSTGPTTTQTFPSWMTDSTWTSAHQLKGIAFMFFRFEYEEGVFDKFPGVDYFSVSGINLTGNDTNPANILKHFLTNSDFGVGIDSGDIDDDSFTTAAAICDQTNSGVKRHECHLRLETALPFVSNIKAILQTCNGRLHWNGGKYRMHINDEFSGSPSVSFDAAKLLSEIEIKGESKRDRATQVIAKWENAGAGDEVAWPDSVNESSTYNAHLTADNSVALKKEINLRGVTNWHQARYLAKQHCLRSRNALRCSFTSTAEALETTPGDVVTITHSTPGWTDKEFRVESVQIGADLSIGVEAVEHQDSHYVWDSTTAPDDAPDTDRPDPTTVTAPTNLSVTESLYSSREGAGLKVKAIVSWTASTGGNVDQYQVEYKLSSASEYIIQLVSLSTTTLDILDLTPGAYDFRVLAINEIGSQSSAITASYTIGGLPTAPAQPTNFRVNSLGTLALAQWNLSADLDVRQGGSYAIAHSPDTSGSVSWDSATVVAAEIAGHSTSAMVPLLGGTYLVRAKDSSDQLSTPATFVHSGASLQALNVVGTVTEEPSFAGVKVQTAAVDDKLKIDSSVQLDSVADVDALADWDSFGSVVTGDGPQYDFANNLDLGSVQAVRLRSYVDSFTDNFLDLIDSRTDNIDTWTDFDNANNGYTSLRLQFRKTDDDPAGASPTWGSWSDFYVTEESARGFGFRCFPKTTDSSNNLVIQGLRIYAEQLAS